MQLSINQIVYLTHYLQPRDTITVEEDSLFRGYIEAMDEMTSEELKQVQQLVSICATIEYMFAKVTH